MQEINLNNTMKMIFPAAISAVLLCAATAPAGTEPAIIPQPQHLTRLEGSLKLAPDLAINTDQASRETGEFLAGRLRKATGWNFRLSEAATPGPAAKTILLTTRGADDSLGSEGYELVVGTNAVVIRASTQAGLFYGAQTLLQLLPPEIFSSNVVRNFDWQIPCVKISDQPRFPWRGLMLDVSRHFFTKDEVKQLLDAMALHKINTFHWHLVDDHGWRIEIERYPKLTSVGAWRSGVGFGLPSDSTTAYGPDGRYGGFYTKADIREVVAYAQERHITILPEIEMPGHSIAALSAYPELSCTGQAQSTDMGAGIHSGIYCAGQDAAFEFLQNVLTEVFELFPSQYIHIGGDEVTKDNWKQCGLCQVRMKTEKLQSEEELQSYFIRRVNQFVVAHDKTLMGWSEILQGGLAQNATVMDWIGGGLEAATQGHDVVMTPRTYCYFDFYQTEDHADEPKAMDYAGSVTLDRTYSFEPIPQGLAPEFHKHILGGQGNVWTEYMPNLKHVEYMTFPRLSALAEATWSPKASRNFDGFVSRLNTHNKRLDQLGINYRHYKPETKITIGGWKPEQISTNASTLEWDVAGHVTGQGECYVNFNYTGGDHGIEIMYVALLENGKEISRDSHDGFAGWRPKQSVYTIQMPLPKPGARYTVRAQVVGSGGMDSAGRVFLDMPPSKNSNSPMSMLAD